MPLLYATGAIALAFTGYGPFAFDAVLGIDHAWTPEIKVAALAVGVVGGRPEPAGPPLDSGHSHGVSGKEERGTRLSRRQDDPAGGLLFAR